MARVRSEEERSFDVAVGKRIMAAREAGNMTQAELATAIGISQQLLAKYESGARVSPMLLRQIAGTLKVSLHWMVPNTTVSCIPERSTQRLMNFD